MDKEDIKEIMDKCFKIKSGKNLFLTKLYKCLQKTTLIVENIKDVGSMIILMVLEYIEFKISLYMKVYCDNL